jgi:hypothetical protein
MKTRRLALTLLLCVFSPLANADSPSSIGPPPEAWNEWARWAEKLHPITDAQGHGPDVGSDEWSGEFIGIKGSDKGKDPTVGDTPHYIAHVTIRRDQQLA